ncbi:MAG: hypothetical protein E6Q89_07400, partial [Bacteroidia bacterium]
IKINQAGIAPFQATDDPIKNDEINPIINASLFNFNPNTASVEDFIQLGLRPKTAQTIINYRTKGGQFRKPDDLKKIYGLKPDDFNRLLPYIQITNQKDAAQYTYNSNNYQSETYKKESQILVEVNSADSTKWKMLYGIRSKYASRIINFREKLGGFYSIDQVGETYGIPDSTFQKIKPKLKIDIKLIKKLDVNTADFNALNAHPYISYQLANLITNYRKNNGNIKSINELELIVKETKDNFEKLINYIQIADN